MTDGEKAPVFGTLLFLMIYNGWIPTRTHLDYLNQILGDTSSNTNVLEILGIESIPWKSMMYPLA